MKLAEASFFKMFTRSRYLRCTEPDDPDQNYKMRQKERFAVAAVGFCLKHSDGFRKEFLIKVCKLDLVGISEQQISIEVEPESWSDLRIVIDGSKRQLCVIEFKIDAPLESKQNPCSERFFSQEGYGSKLLSFKPGGDWAKSYIVVRKTSELLDKRISRQPKNAKISCESIGWQEVGQCSSEDRLIRDLTRSLAYSGVTEFFMRDIKNTKVVGFGDAIEAVKVVQALKGCADFPGAIWKEDIGPPAAGHLNIGCFLWLPDGRQKPVPSPSITETLRLKLQCPGKEMGWFGYETGESVLGGFSKSVWLYCGSVTLANKVGDRVKQAMGAKEVLIDQPYIEGRDCCARIRRQESSTLADVDWFLNVAKAAAGLRA